MNTFPVESFTKDIVLISERCSQHKRSFSESVRLTGISIFSSFPIPLSPLTMNAAVVSLVVWLTAPQLLPTSAFSHIHLRNGLPAAPTTSTSLKLGDFFNNLGKKEDAPAPIIEEAKLEADEEYYDEDDPIEKIFGVFFGKKEKNP